MVMPRQKLRSLRIAADLTQAQAAEKLSVAPKTLARWESGQSTPQPGLRRYIARLYGVDLAQVDMAFNGETHTPFSNQTVVSWLTIYSTFEEAADEVRVYEPVTIHALLQTRDYALAIEQAYGSEDEAQQRTELRMARQDLLDRTDPLHLWAILDESVLHRCAGGRDVMAHQLDWLADRAQQPNVTIQVLPLDPGTHLAGFGSFTVLVSPDTQQPHMACSIDRAGFHYREGADAVKAHADLFDQLAESALSPDESVGLIGRVRKEKYL